MADMTLLHNEELDALKADRDNERRRADYHQGAADKLREDVDRWHTVADERSAEIVRLNNEVQKIREAATMLDMENQDLRASLEDVMQQRLAMTEAIRDAAALYLRLRSSETEYHAPWDEFDAWLERPVVKAARKEPGNG